MILVITDKVREKLPYTCEYAKLYGKKISENTYDVELISTFETPSKYKNKPELLYKECIKSQKRWTDIVSRVSDKVIL